MNQVVQPIWLYTIIATAIIAMLGYLCKLVIEYINKLRAESRLRKSKLIELHSLLLATKSAYDEQCRHRDILYERITERLPSLAEDSGAFDQLFSSVYDQMTEDEREQHLLIRAITKNTLRPLNKLTLNWLQSDVYFKSKTWSKNRDLSQLSKNLRALESHLYLWEAKFLIWIPKRPNHSLVFLADENDEGVTYPKGIETTVGSILERKKIFF